MIKIVIIEDNPGNMKLSTFLLHRAGYEVIQAVDAEAGLPLIRTHLPALVLMDIQLPGMDGLAATRQIKTEPGLAHIKILALTAHAMKVDGKNIFSAGCDGYLPKPFHYRDLLELVEKLLEPKPLTLATDVIG